MMHEEKSKHNCVTDTSLLLHSLSKLTATHAQEQQFKRGDAKLVQVACLMHHLARWGEQVPEIIATPPPAPTKTTLTHALDEGEKSEEGDEERRQDVDGQWYTQREFLDYYGNGCVDIEDLCCDPRFIPFFIHSFVRSLADNSGTWPTK